MTRRWLPWLALVLVVAVALVVGADEGDGPVSADGRVQRIARQVRCPTCQGLSAAESDAKAAEAVRDEIRRRVDDGQDDGEILAFLTSRYGRGILLSPESKGVGRIVWALPVIALVAAAGGLVLVFRRRRGAFPPTTDDRVLVARALGDQS